MAYITIDQLKKQFPDEDLGQLANDATGESSGPKNHAVTLALILDAQSLIDSYLNQKYSVPLAVVPDSIRNATGIITYYKLHERRSEMITDRLQQMYDQTISWLRDLARGLASLPVPPATEGGKAAGYFGAETRIFQGISHDGTTDNMNGF